MYGVISNIWLKEIMQTDTSPILTESLNDIWKGNIYLRALSTCFKQNWFSFNQNTNLFFLIKRTQTFIWNNLSLSRECKTRSKIHKKAIIACPLLLCNIPSFWILKSNKKKAQKLLYEQSWRLMNILWFLSYAILVTNFDQQCIINHLRAENYFYF